MVTLLTLCFLVLHQSGANGQEAYVRADEISFIGHAGGPAWPLANSLVQIHEITRPFKETPKEIVSAISHCGDK